MNSPEVPPVIGQPAPSEAKGLGVMWKIILVVNLILGLFLGFIILTNNSFPGDASNILYGCVTGCVAIYSIFLLVRQDRPRRWARWLYILSCLPALILGIFTMISFPVWICAGFPARNTDTVIQTVISPDRWHLAVVYHHFCRGNACTCDYTNTSLYVRHRFLPYVQRHAYTFKYHLSDPPKSGEFVRWKDNETLIVIDDEMVVERGQYDVVNGKKVPHKKLKREIHEVKIPPTRWIWDVPKSKWQMCG